MTDREYEKKMYFIDTILGAIRNVKVPMLMYEEEKVVVEKALNMYKDKLETDAKREHWEK